MQVQKGMFSVPAQQGQSAVSGNIHYQTADVTFSGFQTNYDKNSFAILDDDDPNLPEGITKEDIEENWFKDPTWMPEEKDTV